MRVIDAFNLAARIHAGQVDKAGAPYILHPVRVMLGLPSDASDIERMAALLHDAIEDGPAGTREELLAAGAPEDLMTLLDALTKVPGEGYDAYIRRVAQSSAHRVKWADMADNSDPERLALLPPALADKLRAKYERAKFVFWDARYGLSI